MAAYNETSKNPFVDDLDELEFDTALSKLEYTQNRVLQSGSRSLGLIEESHHIAIKTAEELQCQEEQLHRIDRNLDDMSSNMTTANRHIKSVKSVWGAIGNYFSKPSPEGKKTETDKSSIPEKSLRIDSELKLNYQEQDYLSDYGREPKARGTAAFERQFDSNLDEISRGLSILKDDALVLGQTMDRQDDIIDRINAKSDLVHDEIRDADRRVKRILRD